MRYEDINLFKNQESINAILEPKMVPLNKKSNSYQMNYLNSLMNANNTNKIESKMKTRLICSIRLTIITWI